MLLPYAPWLCWILPIAGSVLTLLLGRIQPKLRANLAVAFIGISALCSFSMIPDVLTGNIIDWRVSWFYLELGVLVDPLSVLTASLVNGVGFLVAVFSMEYMRRDPSQIRYWFLIQLFIGGLALIVVAGDLLWLFIGWEIVGVSCSALVAFWHRDPSKAHSGLKTFMVLRIGDALLLMSILIIYTYSGTFNLMGLQRDMGWMMKLSRSGLLLITALMLFGGAIAKSAQFPLHVWLPDALPASPASFNALTEVLAGVYLISRVLPMFHSALASGCVELTFFFSAVMWIGALSALLGALMAMVQRSIIRVLVYSIISQYAYMFVGLGVGGLMTDPTAGYLAGNLHLMVDAISSALLFLSAASILYATGSEDMLELGDLRKKMSITFRCMTVGALATIGVPPLSGFWSEEAICGAALGLAHEAGEQGRYALAVSGYGLYLTLIVTATITSFYSIRMIGLIFGKGRREGGPEGKTLSEVPAVMWIPMAIVAIATVTLGILAPFIIIGLRGFFSPFLSGKIIHGGIIDVVSEALFSPGMVVTGIALAVGAIPAYQLYVAQRADSVELIKEHVFLMKAHEFLWNRCYINELYYRTAYNAINIARVAYDRLEHGIDSINYLISRGAVNIARVAYDRLEHGIDSINYLFANRMASLSTKVRSLHTGVLSYNMLAVLSGILLLMVLLLLFGGFV